MPIADTKPSVTPTPADTIVGQEVLFTFEPTGGTAVSIRAKVASLNAQTEKIERKSPSASGLLVTDRTVITGITRTLRLTYDEINASVLTFLNNAYQAGKGKLWVFDPDDATDTASLLSNEFSCSVSPEGELSFQQDQFSEGSIVVDIAGTFTLERDGDVSGA